MPLLLLLLRTLKLTTDGVVKLPRALGTITGCPSTITATAELVVPWGGGRGEGAVGVDERQNPEASEEDVAEPRHNGTCS